MNQNDQACAHSRIRYVTRPVGTQEHPHAVTGSWECDLCSSRFVPLYVAEQAERALQGQKDITVNLSERIRDQAGVEATLRTQLHAKELELNRFRLIQHIDGTSHSTACWIWGDDGQGQNGGPCNCGALENYWRTQLHAAEQANQAFREKLADAGYHEPPKGDEKWCRKCVPALAPARPTP